MSLLRWLGKPNMTKKFTLPYEIKRQIARYVVECDDPKLDDFFFWAQVYETIVKPAGIKCVTSQLRHLYNDEIANEKWDLNLQAADKNSNQTNLEIPRVNSTPWLVGMLNRSELEEIQSTYELHTTDVDRSLEMEKLASRLRASGVQVNKCELLQLYKDLFKTQEKNCFTEFKMQYQEMPMTSARCTQPSELQGSNKALPSNIFDGEKFAILFHNIDWLVLNDARELEYLILVHGGKIEYNENFSDSLKSIPLCIERSREATKEFILKYKSIYDKDLVRMSIKEGTYDKANIDQYLIKISE